MLGIFGKFLVPGREPERDRNCKKNVFVKNVSFDPLLDLQSRKTLKNRSNAPFKPIAFFGREGSGVL
jgi:hypothetical protein